MGGDYHELLASTAAAAGDRLFLRWGEERVSLRQMEERSNQVAQGLVRLGAGPGAVVANMIPDSPETLYALFAAWKIGAVAVPLRPTLKGDRLAALLNHAQATILLTHIDLHANYRRIHKQTPTVGRAAVSLRQASPVLKVFPGVETIQDWLELQSTARPPARPRKGEPALILYPENTDPCDRLVSRYGALGRKPMETAARAVLRPGDALIPGALFFDPDFLRVTLPAVLAAGIAIAREG
jgi:acyl-CoA synthetase (AMP-forming)/AMP-acid ligase II